MLLFTKLSPSIYFMTIGGILSIIGAFLAFRESNVTDQKIIELTTENSELSKQALDLITGGNTFAYLTRDSVFSSKEITSDTVKFFIKVVGPYPIYDLTVSLYKVVFVDTDSNPKPDFTMVFRDDESISYNYKLLKERKVGTLGKYFSLESFGNVVLVNKPFNYFLVKLRARNGEVNQQLIFYQKEKGKWLFATKVHRFKLKGEGTGESTRLYEKIDKDFPLDSVIWFFGIR